MKRYQDRRKQFKCQYCKAVYLGRKYCGSKNCCADCVYVTAPCGICKSAVTVKRSEYKEGRGKFCSKLCANKGLKRYKGSTHWHWKGGLHSVKTRRARMRGAPGIHTEAQWEVLKKQYNYMCLCCKQQEPFIKLTEDHIIPISRGGSHDISNIQPLCKQCNGRKFTKAYAIIGDFTPYELIG